jgi:hypothetical protein
MFVHDIIVKYLINEQITKHHHQTKPYVEQNVLDENELEFFSNQILFNNKNKNNLTYSNF